MKKRANIWPFGKGQPLGRRTTVYKRTRASAPPSSARGEKQAQRERLERKLSDPEIERRLTAHYKRGGTLGEFLAANPGIPGAAFKRCVAAVAEKGSAYDPRAVCAAAGRAKYGAKKFQAMALAGKKRAQRRHKNPAEEAAKVFEEFHGRRSTGTVHVSDRLHYHEHLAELGELKLLVVDGRDGERRKIQGFSYKDSNGKAHPSLLCTNEAKNQLFVRGGDQALDLEEWDIDSPHEVEDLGEVVEIRYFTTKDHLGSEGGTAIYFHKSGTTNVNGKHKKVGYGPNLIYRVRDKQLEFAGGTYEICAEGIDK